MKRLQLLLNSQARAITGMLSPSPILSLLAEACRTKSEPIHVVTGVSSCTCSVTKMCYTTARSAMSHPVVSHKVIA